MQVGLMSDSVHVLGGPDLSLSLGRSLSCILTELSQQQRFLQSSSEKSKGHTVGAQWLTLELKNKNPNYSPKKTQLWILKTNLSTISVPTSAWVLLLQTWASSHQVWLPWLSKASARTPLPCPIQCQAPLIGKTGGGTLLTQASPPLQTCQLTSVFCSPLLGVSQIQAHCSKSHQPTSEMATYQTLAEQPPLCRPQPNTAQSHWESVLDSTYLYGNNSMRYKLLIFL